MESYDLGSFALSTGYTLPSAQMTYKTHGQLSAAKDNAILFPNFLGGPPEALELWIGEGRALDPSRYFIILPGHFGNGSASSPSNTPEPYAGAAFPPVRISDDVAAQHRLVTEHLGIQQLQLILGWSIGGLQTYEWAINYPDMVKRVASIAAAPRPSPWTRLWLRAVLEEPLISDPGFKGGMYADPGEVQGGLRRQGHLAALTLPPLAFYREGEEAWKDIAGANFVSMEDFVVRFWEAFWLSHDPNDLIAQTRKTIACDPTRGGDMAAALRKIKAKMLVLAFTGDPMFPPEECRRDAERIPGAQYREVCTAFGHLATFALAEQDTKAVDGALRELLSS